MSTILQDMREDASGNLNVVGSLLWLLLLELQKFKAMWVVLQPVEFFLVQVDHPLG